MENSLPVGLSFVQSRERISLSLHGILDDFESEAINRRSSLANNLSIVQYMCTPSLVVIVIYCFTFADMDTEPFHVGVLCSMIFIGIVAALNVVLALRYVKAHNLEIADELTHILQQYQTLLKSANDSTTGQDEILLPTGHSHVSIVNTYRNNRWLKLPVLLLAEGDIIALMGGDVTPGKVYELESGIMGPLSPLTGSASQLIPPMPVDSPKVNSKSSAHHRAYNEGLLKRGKLLAAGQAVHIRKQSKSFSSSGVGAAGIVSSSSSSAVMDDLRQQAAVAVTAVSPLVSVGMVGVDDSEEGRAALSYDNAVECIRPSLAAVTSAIASSIAGVADASSATTANTPPAAPAAAVTEGLLLGGERHRTIAADSAEILRLSGDMRCFEMVRIVYDYFLLIVCRSVPLVLYLAHCDTLIVVIRCGRKVSFLGDEVSHLLLV
jgi:hypothetical protein